jgi:hypothetical protein
LSYPSVIASACRRFAPDWLVVSVFMVASVLRGRGARRGSRRRRRS